jgi:G3E family GTPase
VNPIPVVLLTGFLGSGKTTLLSRLLSSPGFQDSAVIINEVGDVGLDHALIERGREDVVLLEGGCICCRLKGGLNDTLVALLRRASDQNMPLRRIIVETSGLTDPLPVLGALIADPRFSRNFTLAGVTTVIDAVNFSNTHSRFPEARMQVALADRLLISKADLAGDAEVDQVDAKLSALNRLAERFVMTSSVADGDRVWIDPLRDAVRPVAARRFWANEVSSNIVSASQKFSGELAYDAVDEWLDDVTGLFGDRLLRLKGVLRIEGLPDAVVVHGVQGLVYSPGTLPQSIGTDSAANSMVLIAHDVEQQDLADALTRLVLSATADGERRRPSC